MQTGGMASTAILNGAIDEDRDIVVVRIKNRPNPSYKSSQSAGYKDVAINFRIIDSETKSLGLDTPKGLIHMLLKSSLCFAHLQK